MSLRILLSTQNEIPFVRGCNIWYFVKIKKFYIVPLKFIDIYPSNNTNGSVESNIHYDFLYQDTMETHKSNACSVSKWKISFFKLLTKKE